MKKNLLPIVIFMAVIVSASWAVDKSDTFRWPDTIRAAFSAGDTNATYQVSVTSNTAVLARAANTTRARRRLCLQNLGSEKVNIGSSSTSAELMYVLGESTNTALCPIFCTNSSSAYWATKNISFGTTSVTLNAYEETQSVP